MKTRPLLKMYPTINLGQCSYCRGCLGIAPQVFRYNQETGLMEVVEMHTYPVEAVDEAIKNCPKDCISWED